MERIEPETDPVSYAKVAAGLLVTLVVFATVSFFAWRLERGRRRAIPEAPTPAGLGRAEIASIDQVPFRVDARQRTERTEKERWLHGYGWVDADAGIAHVPIELAERWLVEANADGGAELRLDPTRVEQIPASGGPP